MFGYLFVSLEWHVMKQLRVRILDQKQFLSKNRIISHIERIATFFFFL